MDYSKLSDRDIDYLVLQTIYGNQTQDRDIMRIWVRGGFQYMTNPADAWPIITENMIAIIPSNLKDGRWAAQADDWDFAHSHENPLRAAMVVYLMMQEAK